MNSKIVIQNIKHLLASSALVLLAACGNSSDTSPSGASSLQTNTATAPTVQLAVDAYRPPANTNQVTALQPLSASMAPTATSIKLGTPLASLSAAAQDKSAASMGMGKPHQVSFGRDVLQAASSGQTSQLLDWQPTLNGGQTAAISITSTGAKALRMGLRVTQLPDAATLRFYNQGSATAYVFSGKEVNATLAQNLAAGDKTDAGRTYWGPIIEGAESTVEIAIPAGVRISDIAVALPQVSHFFVSANTMATMASTGTNLNAMAPYTWPNDGLSCQVDVKCAALPAVSDSVAMLYFQKNGSTFQCSGTLLNNTANNALPYLLTANHCIDNQTVASTLSTLWLYRSASCNATTGSYQQVSSGAALKYTAYDTDSTLLLMNSAAPAGTLFAGWDASPQALSTSLTGIHHPQADAQRKSTGTITSYYTRDTADSNNFFTSSITNSTVLQVTMTSGIVESGSSGSGIFKDIGSANPQLVGQLFGGQSASCSASGTSNPQITAYGRFDYAFAAGMSDWLSPNRKPVYRFYNTSLGTHFFTMSGIERNNIIATLPQYSYEGISFYAYPTLGGAADLSPVFRFFNTNTGAHFYTINVGERDTVIATLPQYSYEGIKWYAQTSNVAGTTPLYRFFHTINGTHFYTINSIERDNVINLLPVYSYEGVAYNVWPTQ